ncbi:hypothetical protein ILUMI_03050 [Ignelater luminosus]|uniref:Transposase n=1 Tax=Ignelater luminosus TaxID=2038154 RepID=A0A8K0GMK2_IGNLU|nr:hypothetical protein ILUMI_03050 [Ignelater luminosus]
MTQQKRLMYMRLKNGGWKNVITSDEAWFYLRTCRGKREVEYISREQKRCDAAIFESVAHPQGIMMWVGLSANGPTKPIVIEPKAKICSSYYVNKDSAPAHRAKATLLFLREQNVSFIEPEQWLPSSPDCAPCDYCLWGYLKSQVNKRNIKTLCGLKKAVQDELKKISQSLINKALAAWPKRCRLIYKNKGEHIEKYF